MFRQGIRRFGRHLLRTGASTRAMGLRYRRNAKGVVAIETALVLPVMVLLYFGLVDVADLMSANRKVTLTAGTIADLVAQAPGDVKKADLKGFLNAVKPIMDPYPSNRVGLEILGFEKNGRNIRQSWQYRSGQTCGDTPSTNDMKKMMIDDNDLIIAKVCFRYEPVTGKVIGTGTWNLDDVIMMRPRNVNQIRCTDC